MLIMNSKAQSSSGGDKSSPSQMFGEKLTGEG
jgi:hypothetical protein